MNGSGRRRFYGFTLIELLVVIAIIAILAAILFPVFAQAREKARQSTCQSNLKQFGNAFSMYKQDYDEQFPFGGWYGQNTGAGTPDARVDRSNDWHISLLPYIKNIGVNECPSSTDIHKNPADWNRTPTDYLYNNFLAEGRVPKKDAALNAPADCILLIEGHNDWGRGECITPFNNPNRVFVNGDIWCGEYTTHGKSSSLITGSLWAGNPGELRVWGLPRHPQQAQVLFADGHVKTTTGLDARNGRESRLKMDSRLPWQKHGDPTQLRVSFWEATE